MVIQENMNENSSSSSNDIDESTDLTSKMQSFKVKMKPK